MTFIVDSSVSLAWCFEDERTAVTDSLLDRAVETGASAPQHWPLEVMNGLMMAERRHRLDAHRRRLLAAYLRDLPITPDPETTIQVWDATQDLAERFRLTIYDAAYLELAQRRGLPLATLDRQLRAAAEALGVAVLGGG